VILSSSKLISYVSVDFWQFVMVEVWKGVPLNGLFHSMVDHVKVV
jgi:hypothetical protein